jgi:hypothetical protein
VKCLVTCAHALQVYPVKPEAFLDAILDPQTGENVDLQMNFEGLQAAVDLRQVSTSPGILTQTSAAVHGASARSPRQPQLGCCSLVSDRRDWCSAC